MAIGGDLISSFPASGLSASEIPLGTAADNEDLAALPNERAKVIIENEHGEEVPLAEASASTPPALRHDGSFTKPISAASSSQDTLAAPVACEKTLKDVPVSTLASAGLTGLERQLERVNDNLEAGQEARLDFTSVSLDVRQAFILKVTKALLSFGSPSHRVEADLDFAAEIVGVPAQFVHHPNCVVVNFGVAGSHLSDTITVKHQNGGLDLGSLHAVNQLWRSVESGHTTVKEATLCLDVMMETKPIYSIWQRVVIAGCMSALICPMGFSGSFADAMLAGVFASILTWLKLGINANNQRFHDIFEIVVASAISFAAKGLSRAGHIFCYEATLSAGLVGILPGFIILAGSLELAGKNFVGGAVRLVYAIIYSLFLGFGIGVGSDLYGLMDRRRLGPDDTDNTVNIMGTVYNGTVPFLTGSFSFDNGTLSDSLTAINSGNIKCNRASTDGWYARPLSNDWYLFLLVPAFAVLLALSNLQPLKRRELLAMVCIGCAGWVTNHFSGLYIPHRSDIVSCIGGLTVGVLANVYGRITRSSSFVVGITGILYLVPSGIAAAGGLVISGRGQASDGAVYQHSLGVGLLMVEIAIGITVGLFFSSFLAHLCSSRRSKLNDHLRAFSF